MRQPVHPEPGDETMVQDVRPARAVPRGKRPWPNKPTMDEQQITLQLQQLLQQSMAGEVQGLIVAVHYGGQQFGFAGAGTFCKQPSLVENVLRHFRHKFIDPFVSNSKSKT